MEMTFDEDGGIDFLFDASAQASGRPMTPQPARRPTKHQLRVSVGRPTKHQLRVMRDRITAELDRRWSEE